MNSTWRIAGALGAFFAMAGCIGAEGVARPGPLNPPATVVVAFDGQQVTPLIAEGMADRSSGRAVAANDPVRIASISKLIMALAALRLADDGVVDLDADVSRYLGWTLRAPQYPDDAITLRQLLSHRSGLRDDAGYVVALGESLREKLGQSEAWYEQAPPGEAPFAYANIGSALVATVLEAASGERYDALLERMVFRPLSIEACTNWIGCGDAQRAQAVVLYRDTGELAADPPADIADACTVPVADGVACDLNDYAPGTNASIFSPQGGVRIGMVDLARLGQALANGGAGLIGPEALAAMLSSAQPDIPGEEFFCGYGLGVQMIEASARGCVDDLFMDDRARWGHPGEAYGLRSGLWFDPETGRGMAYFITAVPPRSGAEDEGGFDQREIDLIARAQEMLETAP